MYLVWQLILEIYLFLSERTEPIRQSSKFVFKAPAVMLSLQAVLLAKLLLWESLISFSCFPREDRSTNRIWSNRHQFKLKHRKYVVWMICRGENKNKLVTRQTGLCLSAQVSQTLCLKLNVDYVFTRQFWAKKNPDTFPHIPNTVTHRTWICGKSDYTAHCSKFFTHQTLLCLLGLQSWCN